MNDAYAKVYIEHQAKIIEELEAQIAVMREALEFYAVFDNYCNVRGFYIRDEPLPNVIQDKGKRALEALSLTPSEAAEMVRKKNELIKTLVACLEECADRYRKSRNGFGFDIGSERDFMYRVSKAIEAARAAGVEV